MSGAVGRGEPSFSEGVVASRRGRFLSRSVEEQRLLASEKGIQGQCL